MLTLKDMIEVSRFNDFKIIAGEKGTCREIKSVSVMDAPDIYKWMKGGEFLITTGYCMKESPEYMEFLIEKLNENGASGLGIKLGRFIHEIPLSVIKIANKLEFPLIHIPLKYAFIDVINPVLSNLVNSQAIKLMYSEKIHKSFTQLVIEGGSTKQIIDTLSSILEKDIFFYNISIKDHYISSCCSEFIENVNLNKLEELLHKYDYYTVRSAKKVYGYLIFPKKLDDKNLKEYEEIALEHASTVLKLNIESKITNLQIEKRYRDEFVNDIIMKNIKSIDEVNSRSKIYGWDFNKKLFCMVVDIDNYKARYLQLNTQNKRDKLENTKKNIFFEAKEMIKNYFPQVIYTNFSDSIIFILEMLNDKQKFESYLLNICDNMRNKISKDKNFTVTIGIGEYKDSAMDIHKSFKEARSSVKIGRIIYKKDKTIFYNKLGIYKLLSNIYNTPECKDFCMSNLHNLIEYDKVHNSNLLSTLKFIIKNDWNLKSASKEMFTHYNTIKYRFNKIQDILNIDFNNVEEKLNVIVSIKLLEMED